MIYFLTTRRHRYTMGNCLQTDGQALAPHVTMINYGNLFLRRRFPRGVYIFADLERLSPADLRRAETIWDHLASDGQSVLQNRPTRVMKRYALLRAMHARGQNQFNIFRLTEPNLNCRFPVFIRGENDHKGAMTELIHSQAELDRELRRIDKSWKGRAGKVITEFCDISDEEGIYRKYSAFRIDGKIYPRHLFFRNNWVVKAWKRLDPHLLEEERKYVETNPHHRELLEIFDVAGIDFGRIDYGVLDGKIQVWEINTNPVLLANFGGGGEARQALHDRFTETFVGAVRQLAQRVPADTGMVQLKKSPVAWWLAPRLPLEFLYRRLAPGV